MTPTDKDNPQEVAGTGSLAPTAYESGKVRDVNEDSFNPLGNSVDMWEQAGKYFMNAGKTANVEPDDGIITAGAKRANNYYTGMSLAALTGAEAVYQSAASLISNIVFPGMTDEEEKRLQRDLSAMPEAFAGTAVVGKIDAAEEAFGIAARGLRAQGSELLDNISTNTLGSNLGQAFTPKVTEDLSNRIPKFSPIGDFSKIGNTPDSNSKLPAFVDGLTIPEKGMKGSNVLKALEAHPDIRTSSINLDRLDKGKRYSREGLHEFFKANEVRADFVVEGKYAAHQRQRDIGFYGEEKDYNSVAINIVPSKGLPPFKVKGSHFYKNTAAHLRFTEVEAPYFRPDMLNQFGDFRKALGLGPGKPKVRMIVLDELQSDALRNPPLKTLDANGKEKIINQEFNNKTNDHLSHNLSPDFYDSKTDDTSLFGYNTEVNGSDVARETVSVYKEAMHNMRRSGVEVPYSSLEGFDEASSDLLKKVRNDIMDGKTIDAKDLIHITDLNTRKYTMPDNYMGGSFSVPDSQLAGSPDLGPDDYLRTIESIVDEIDQKWTPTILREDSPEFASTFDQLPKIGAAKISAKEGEVDGAIEDYQKALAKELMRIHNEPKFVNHDLIDNHNKLRSEFITSFRESLNKVDSKGLLSNYTTDSYFINDALRDYDTLYKSSKSPKLDRKFSKSPISNVSEIQNESISVLIKNASEKGIDFIVLPRVDAMYKVRPALNPEKDNMLKRMYDYTATLKGFEETYPGLKVHSNVNAPYVVAPEQAKGMLDRSGIDLGGHLVNIGGKKFNVRGEAVDIIDLTNFKEEFDGTNFRSFAEGGLVSSENEVSTVDEQMNKLIQSGSGFSEGGLASSKRPQARPEGLTEKDNNPKALDPEMGLGDVEMAADMSELLYNDPVARLGYRNAKFDYGDTVAPSEDYNATYNTETSLISYDSATGSSKDVIAHEARHGGTQRVYELYVKDPEDFEAKFGPEVAKLMQYQQGSDELIVEYNDNPDATWIRPVGEGGSVVTNFSDTIQDEDPEELRKMRESGVWREDMIKHNKYYPSTRERLGDSEGVSGEDWYEWFPEEYQKAQEGLSAAALYLLREDGEPPQVSKQNPDAIDNWEDPNPSLWDKVVSTVTDTLSPKGDHYPISEVEATSKGYSKGGIVSKENEVNTVDEQMNKLIQSGGVAKYG